MKVICITLGETRIELHNSLFGKETIIVNGEIVSAKSSFSGTEHTFSVNEEGTVNQYKLTTGLNINGVAINLFKNDQAIIEAPNKSKWAFWIIAISIGVLFAILLNIGRELA